MKTLFSVLALSFLSMSAFAEPSVVSACSNGKNWQCKNARSSDGAVDQYMLDKATGNFYRYFKNGRTCQITSNVKDFKISQHPNDVAVVYYESNNDLYIVRNQGTQSGDCPPVSKKVLMANVKEWKMVSNTNTTIVNAASDVNGNFIAWDNTHSVYSDIRIVDFQMNQCFGASGKSFSSYVLFTLDSQGNVNKVKVSGGFFTADKTTVQHGNWTKLSDWKKDQGGICK